MAAVPVPPVFASGILTTTQLNQLGDAVRFLQRAPAISVRQTVAQTLTTGVWAAITMDAEEFDVNVGNFAQHDNAVNSSRLMCVYPGRYLLCAVGATVFNATGSRGCRFYVNGTALESSGGQVQAIAVAFGTLATAGGAIVSLSVGDYAEAYAFQSSGGNLATQVVSTGQSGFWALWVGN